MQAKQFRQPYSFGSAIIRGSSSDLKWQSYMQAETQIPQLMQRSLRRIW
jgi:hypothetical protein